MKMNRRTWFGAGAMVAVASMIELPEKYRMEVDVHVIKSFKKSSVFEHRPSGWKTTVPSFRIDAEGSVLSSASKGSADPNLTVDNALSNRGVMDNLRAMAESSYDMTTHRDVVLCNLVLEAPDGKHVTRVGMMSSYDNKPVTYKT